MVYTHLILTGRTGRQLSEKKEIKMEPLHRKEGEEENRSPKEDAKLQQSKKELQWNPSRKYQREEDYCESRSFLKSSSGESYSDSDISLNPRK